MGAYRKRKSLLNCLLNSAEVESNKKVLKDKGTEAEPCIILESPSTGESNSTNVPMYAMAKDNLLWSNLSHLMMKVMSVVMTVMIDGIYTYNYY